MLKLTMALLLFASPILAGPLGHEATLRALMPDNGRLLNGVFPGGYSGDEDDITPDQVRDYERLVGKRVAWVMFSHNWFQGRAFPAETAGWIRGQGATPYIRVMLRSDTELSHRAPLYTLQAIVDGDFDSDLAAWGQAAAQFGTPIIAEYGTEMNGDWFPWNARWNGRKRGAALFQQAYRHIIDVVRTAGGSNVIWVFHVNNLDGPPKQWNRFEGYYPGDDYIDWLGVSIYSAQGPHEDWTVDFTESLPDVMARFAAMAPEKPVIVAEFGTDVHNAREPAGPWADAALSLMLSGRYSNLIGFNWWNETWPNGDDPVDATDYRVGASAALTAVMRRHLANRRVQGRP
ncbi:MAG: beta-mannanase [Rhodobacteraceae bacterium]|nr:beta-mannanase [Paracoccaceae bacterium]